jgi:hypothetical protein
LKDTQNDFKTRLAKYIQFRAIDIVLYLKDGTTIELDKNRTMEGDIVINGQKSTLSAFHQIHVDEIMKADFYAA